MAMAVYLATSSRRSPSSIAVSKHRVDHMDRAVIAGRVALQSLIVVPRCEVAVRRGLAAPEATRLDRTDFMAALPGHVRAMDRTSTVTSLVRRGRVQLIAVTVCITERRTKDHGIATQNPEAEGRTIARDHTRAIQTIAIAPMRTRHGQTLTYMLFRDSRE